MKFQALFFFLFLGCLVLCGTQWSFGNCCLGHSSRIRASMGKIIESYKMQETDGECNMRAVKLRLKKRSGEKKARIVCANPDDAVVQNLMGIVDARITLQK